VVIFNCSSSELVWSFFFFPTSNFRIEPLSLNASYCALGSTCACTHSLSSPFFLFGLRAVDQVLLRRDMQSAALIVSSLLFLLAIGNGHSSKIISQNDLLWSDGNVRPTFFVLDGFEGECHDAVVDCMLPTLCISAEGTQLYNSSQGATELLHLTAEADIIAGHVVGDQINIAFIAEVPYTGWEYQESLVLCDSLVTGTRPTSAEPPERSSTPISTSEATFETTTVAPETTGTDTPAAVPSASASNCMEMENNKGNWHICTKRRQKSIQKHLKNLQISNKKFSFFCVVQPQKKPNKNAMQCNKKAPSKTIQSQVARIHTSSNHAVSPVPFLKAHPASSTSSSTHPNS
jgi:hypothetical protein